MFPNVAGDQRNIRSGDRCAGQISSPERAGFLAFDRADARRRAGCDRSDQRGEECGPDRRVDPGVEGRGAGSPSGDVPCETD